MSEKWRAISQNDKRAYTEVGLERVQYCYQSMAFFHFIIFFFQAVLYWGPFYNSREQKQTLFTCFLRGMVSQFLLCGDGRVVARGQVEGWLRYFAHPLDSGACRGHVQYPAFAPDPLIINVFNKQLLITS